MHIWYLTVVFLCNKWKLLKRCLWKTAVLCLFMVFSDLNWIMRKSNLTACSSNFLFYFFLSVWCLKRRDAQKVEFLPPLVFIFNVPIVQSLVSSWTVSALSGRLVLPHLLQAFLDILSSSAPSRYTLCSRIGCWSSLVVNSEFVCLSWSHESVELHHVRFCCRIKKIFWSNAFNCVGVLISA